METPRTTATLGTYDAFEVDIVVQILNDNGIYATTKNPTTEPEHSPYPGILTSQGVVLVDAERLEDARRLIAEELPRFLASPEESPSGSDG